MRRWLLLLLIVAYVSGQGASLAPVVQIVRAPSVVFDDEQITIQVRVEPDEKNRLLIVSAWDGDTSVRTSLEQLEGEDSPRTRWLKWQRLAAGELELRAYVFGEKGQLGLARHALIVRARWD